MERPTRPWRGGGLHGTDDTGAARLLIVAPTRRELAGLRFGRSAGYGVAVLGLGKAAADGLREVLKSRTPHVLLSVGFAGALSPDLRTGDLVVSTEAAVQPASKPASLSASLGNEAFKALALAGMRVTTGSILTVPRPLMSKDEKQRYGKTTGAAVVDMETYWIAEEADRADVPVVSVRTVVDELDHDLPDLVAQITADERGRKLYHALRAMRNPASIGALVPLAARSRKAANASKKAVRTLVPVCLRCGRQRPAGTTQSSGVRA
jgi:nucleoside phosphorylase